MEVVQVGDRNSARPLSKAIHLPTPSAFLKEKHFPMYLFQKAKDQKWFCLYPGSVGDDKTSGNPFAYLTLTIRKVVGLGRSHYLPFAKRAPLTNAHRARGEN